MRAWSIFVAVAALLFARPAAPIPASAQLPDQRPYFLTAEEVGEGFAVVREAEIFRWFVRTSPVEGSLRLTMFLDPPASPAEFLVGIASAYDARDDFLDATVTPAPSPGIGEQSVRARVEGTERGRPFSGDIIVWRHRGVQTTLVLAQFGGDASGIEIARRQQAKLERLLGPGEAPPTPANVRAGVVTTTSMVFAWDPTPGADEYAVSLPYDEPYVLVPEFTRLSEDDRPTLTIIAPTVVRLSGLTPGTRHCLAVRAVNRHGSSDWSAWACATTAGDTGGGR